MIDLSIKLVEQLAASGIPPEAASPDGWKSVAENLQRSQMDDKLHYMSKLLNRARCRGLKIESFYITDTEEYISNQRKCIKFKHEFLEALEINHSDLSYAVFSAFYECSKYAIRSFYVLRFPKSLKKIFYNIVMKTMKENEFNVWMFECNYEPYIIFDAYENGVEYFFSEAAKRIKKSQVKKLFHLDYFTNAPWCWVDLDAETIEDIVRLKGTIEVEIHQKMMRSRRGKQSLFWKHVFRMARKYFPKK